MARWRLKTFSSASEISPTVARARDRLDRSAEEIALAALRRLGQCCERGLDAARVAGGAEPLEPLDLRPRTALLSMSRSSTRRRLARRYLLTPTIVSSPRSMRAWRRAAASSMRSLGMPLSTALVMPPIASTSSISAMRRVASEWVRLST